MATDDLTVNSHASLRVERAGGEAREVLISAPVRGSGRRLSAVRRGEDPELFAALLSLCETEGEAGAELELGDEGWEALHRTGFLVRDDERPERVAFRCFLEPETLALVPRAMKPRLPAEPLVVNPTLRVEDAPALGEEGAFLEGYPVAWVESHEGGGAFPYWLRGPIGELVASLEPSEPAPAGIGKAESDLLRLAGVLVPWSFPGRRAGSADATGFRSRGYAVVPRMLPPLQLAALRRHYRELLREGYLVRGDGRVADRDVAHDEPVARFFHDRLARRAGELTGEPMVPSYAYSVSYRRGAALPPHTDRAQCELSISLLVDYTPEPAGRCGWPLFIEAGRSPAPIAVDLEIGAGVLYRGRELVHSREPLQDERSTSLLLHYVRPDFTGPLE